MAMQIIEVRKGCLNVAQVAMVKRPEAGRLEAYFAMPGPAQKATGFFVDYLSGHDAAKVEKALRQPP